MLFFWRVENRSSRRKTSWCRVRNQQTQPTYMTPSLVIKPGSHWWEASALTTSPNEKEWYTLTNKSFILYILQQRSQQSILGALIKQSRLRERRNRKIVSLVQTVYLQVRFSHPQYSLVLKLPNFFQIGKDLENIHTNHKKPIIWKAKDSKSDFRPS